MQCSCGGETAQTQSVSGNHVLKYERCSACSRQGKYVFVDSDGKMFHGESARQAFINVSRSETGNRQTLL